MARKAGRNARLYVALTDSGAASPVSNTRTWSIDSTRDQLETTCQGDSSKTYVTGLPGGSGSLTAVFDDSVTAATFSASLDGLSRRLYGYMDSSVTGQYFYCTATFSASLSTDVNGLVEVSGNWQASTPVVWVGV